MPAPTNISAATATVISSLSYSATQRVDDAGTTFTVWYRFTAPTGLLAMGFFAFENQVGDVYDPTVDVFIGGGAVPYLSISATEAPIQFPITVGETYYFRIDPQGGNPSPAELGVSAYAAPQGSVGGGDILVNDDSFGFPAVIIGSDGTVRNITAPFPAGEAGDILSSGAFVLNDFNTQTLHFFDDQFNLVTTVAIGNSDPRIRTSQGLQQFFVGWRTSPSPVTIKRYSGVGVELASHSLTGVTNLLGMAGANDGTSLYWSNNSVSSPIRRWDLVGAAELSQLAAGIVGRWIPDILVLSDGTIIASSVQIVFGTFDVHHYSAAGTLLNTYTIGTTLLPSGTFPRLAYSPTDPASFFVWWHPSAGLSRFQEIRVSDGVVLQTRNVTEFEGGISQTGAGDFGVSFSCPFLVLRTTIDATTATTVIAPGVQSNVDETLFLTVAVIVGVDGCPLPAPAAVTPGRDACAAPQPSAN